MKLPAKRNIVFLTFIVQKIQIEYINEHLHINMVNWKEVYLLSPKIVALQVELDRGRSIYRMKESTKRISDATLKKE